MSKHAPIKPIAPVADAPDPLDLKPKIAAEPLPSGAMVPRPDAWPPAPEIGEDSPTPYLDAHGFDPVDFTWRPVRRRPRKDGWSEAKQRLFIETLADTACVEQAARAVGMSERSAYALRRAPGGEAFAAAWEAAIHHGALKLVDIAFDRAIHGSDEPVFDKEGRRVGRRMRQNDRLLMFLMRAHMPDRYRHAHRDRRTIDEPLPPETLPVARAIALLEPALPPEPEKLMTPGELDTAVEVADMCAAMGEELSPWLRPVRPEPDYVEFPLGEDFERQLEAAKNGQWPLEDDEDWDEEEWDDDDLDEDDALDEDHDTHDTHSADSDGNARKTDPDG